MSGAEQRVQNRHTYGQLISHTGAGKGRKKSFDKKNVITRKYPRVKKNEKLFNTYLVSYTKLTQNH
jgi:hypothetical protein